MGGGLVGVRPPLAGGRYLITGLELELLLQKDRLGFRLAEELELVPGGTGQIVVVVRPGGHPQGMPFGALVVQARAPGRLVIFPGGIIPETLLPVPGPEPRPKGCVLLLFQEAGPMAAVEAGNVVQLVLEVVVLPGDEGTETEIVKIERLIADLQVGRVVRV